MPKDMECRNMHKHMLCVLFSVNDFASFQLFLVILHCSTIPIISVSRYNFHHISGIGVLCLIPSQPGQGIWSAVADKWSLGQFCLLSSCPSLDDFLRPYSTMSRRYCPLHRWIAGTGSHSTACAVEWEEFPLSNCLRQVWLTPKDQLRRKKAIGLSAPVFAISKYSQGTNVLTALKITGSKKHHRKEFLFYFIKRYRQLKVNCTVFLKPTDMVAGSVWPFVFIFIL